MRRLVLFFTLVFSFPSWSGLKDVVEKVQTKQEQQQQKLQQAFNSAKLTLLKFQKEKQKLLKFQVQLKQPLLLTLNFKNQLKVKQQKLLLLKSTFLQQKQAYQLAKQTYQKLKQRLEKLEKRYNQQADQKELRELAKLNEPLPEDQLDQHGLNPTEREELSDYLLAQYMNEKNKQVAKDLSEEAQKTPEFAHPEQVVTIDNQPTPIENEKLSEIQPNPGTPMLVQTGPVIASSTPTIKKKTRIAQQAFTAALPPTPVQSEAQMTVELLRYNGEEFESFAETTLTTQGEFSFVTDEIENGDFLKLLVISENDENFELSLIAWDQTMQVELNPDNTESSSIVEKKLIRNLTEKKTDPLILFETLALQHYQLPLKESSGLLSDSSIRLYGKVLF